MFLSHSLHLSFSIFVHWFVIPQNYHAQYSNGHKVNQCLYVLSFIDLDHCPNYSNTSRRVQLSIGSTLFQLFLNLSCESIVTIHYLFIHPFKPDWMSSLGSLRPFFHQLLPVSSVDINAHHWITIFYCQLYSY